MAANLLEIATLGKSPLEAATFLPELMLYSHAR